MFSCYQCIIHLQETEQLQKLITPLTGFSAGCALAPQRLDGSVCFVHVGLSLVSLPPETDEFRYPALLQPVRALGVTRGVSSFTP